MRELRIFSLMALFAMSFVIAKSTASQHPGGETAPPVSPAGDDQLLSRAATLVRQSQHGTESFAASMREITTLLTEHPDAVVAAPLLAAILDGMHEKDATHNFKVAMFYLQSRGKEAAELRLRQIVEKYPKYSRLDEVLYQLSILEYEAGHRAEATQTLERLISGYEFSPRKSEAQSKLKGFKAVKR